LSVSKTASAGDRFSRAVIICAARAGIALSPASVLAAWARAFTRRAVKLGRGVLAESSAPVRVLAGTAAPFSRLELDIGGKPVTVEVLPWLAWFRSSVFCRALSKSDLIDMSRRFSCKVRLRAIVPSGPPLPIAAYPGVLSDATGDVLEWLINRYI
jgi:hypothetical protein